MALEFATKDAAATMRTMVAEPYVNHVPTLTGGIGQQDLYVFYRDYFIPSNPPSTSMKLVSRTIGVDRVVDEMVFSFDHTQEVPWMLPGVPPTGRKVSVALVAIVCIRGGNCITSIFTGIRRVCLCRLACWIRSSCRRV